MHNLPTEHHNFKLADLFISVIGFYRKALSPFLGNVCRFYPSCSEYTQTCIRRFGIIKGLRLGTNRICRCHPFHQGGVDLPPSKEA